MCKIDPKEEPRIAGRDDPRNAGCGGRSSFSGDYRLGPAPCGNFRPILVRDLRGMRKRPAVDMSMTYTICRTFTGATGLEPATSGVTGRRSNQLNYAPRANPSVARRCR